MGHSQDASTGVLGTSQRGWFGKLKGNHVPMIALLHPQMEVSRVMVVPQARWMVLIVENLGNMDDGGIPMTQESSNNQINLAYLLDDLPDRKHG